ncbi:GAF domain-containing protein [Peribacillus frigoritolerans]|uniref:GAF domain-containing protein n=1 Tax=Peribacillus castrilensis TaxID=2897690 RepID=UPI003DA34DDE
MSLNPEFKENDQIPDLVQDGRYKPSFRDRMTEKPWTYTLKLLGNFFVSIVTFLNIPGLALALLFFIDQVGQGITNNENWGLGLDIKVILYVIVGWTFFMYFWDKTWANMTRPTILPIWFVNSKGLIKNPFFSYQVSKSYSANLDDLITEYSEEYARQRTKAIELQNTKLTEVISKLTELNQFPNEVFESLKRMIEALSNYVTDSNNPRNTTEALFDRILVEINNYRFLQNIVRRASIMLLDSEGKELYIAGQYRLPANSVNSKRIPVGQKFAGKVVEEGRVIWIPNVDTYEAKKQYGFDTDPDRQYKGIMGFPIKEMGVDIYKPIGVINIHFINEIELDNLEMISISKIMEVYSEIIISATKLKKYRENVIINEKEGESPFKKGDGDADGK